jgi:hypothetical protein
MVRAKSGLEFFIEVTFETYEAQLVEIRRRVVSVKVL